MDRSRTDRPQPQPTGMATASPIRGSSTATHIAMPAAIDCGASRSGVFASGWGTSPTIPPVSANRAPRGHGLGGVREGLGRFGPGSLTDLRAVVDNARTL